MINYDVTKENINQHNLNWPQIPDHPYRKLLSGTSGFGKTNALLHLIKQQDSNDYSITDKRYMLRIHMEQNINILLESVKIMVLKI